MIGITFEPIAEIYLNQIMKCGIITHKAYLLRSQTGKLLPPRIHRYTIRALQTRSALQAMFEVANLTLTLVRLSCPNSSVGRAED